MKSNRSLILRKQNSPNRDSLSYPYLYLNEYDLNPTQIIGEPKKDPIDFPSCISQYYWIHEGINDEVPWRALFEYKDNDGHIHYGFYIGDCDYTGFDCRGSMRLYLSEKVDILIEKAFTDEDYRLYIEETQ